LGEKKQKSVIDGTVRAWVRAAVTSSCPSPHPALSPDQGKNCANLRFQTAFFVAHVRKNICYNIPQNNYSVMEGLLWISTVQVV
jgi:hypothetical protein